MTALPRDPAVTLPGWMDLPDGLSAAEYQADLPCDYLTGWLGTGRHTPRS